VPVVQSVCEFNIVMSVCVCERECVSVGEREIVRSVCVASTIVSSVCVCERERECVREKVRECV